MIGQVLHVTHVIKVQFRQDHFAWVHLNKDFKRKKSLASAGFDPLTF